MYWHTVWGACRLDSIIECKLRKKAHDRQMKHDRRTKEQELKEMQRQRIEVIRENRPTVSIKMKFECFVKNVAF